ncbi:MAG: PAS domain S-box protein, partial [Chromatiales bacterium]|nr:PAS domain S-box protein [Chromatiales bacterium]
GFWWLNHLNVHHQHYDKIIDGMYEIDRQVSLSHLWFDDQANLETAQIRSLLEEAYLTADGLVTKLQQDKELLANHPQQLDLIVGMKEVREMLFEMKNFADELHLRADGKTFTEYKKQFDNSCHLFADAALRVEEIMKQDSSKHMRNSLYTFRLIFAGWILLVVFLLLVILKMEFKRKSIAQALADSEEKFRTMAESARDAIILADGNGRISYWNHAAEIMFGKLVNEVVGEKICDTILPATQDQYELDRCAALWQSDDDDCTDENVIEIMVNSGGKIFPVEVSVAPILLNDQSQNIAILRDITERKRSEQVVRDSESLLRTLVNAMPDFVCFKDSQGRWLMANEFGLKLFAIDNIDYQNKTDSELAENNDFYREAFLTCVESDKKAWLAGKESRYDEIIPRPVGDPLIYDIIKVPIFNDDNSRKGLLVIGRDITMRKTIEKALQDSEERLRHLSANLFVMQESERRRVANELHDELGQSLVALKMQVRSIQRHLATEHSEEVGECDAACEHINQIIENVRRLSRDLSPVVLDDLGLGAAIKHLVENFSKLHDIDGTLTMDDIGHHLTSSEERIVYRIVQEALTNIAKHAKARNVEIFIRKRNQWINFLIRDDGCGFDSEKVAKKKSVERGLGLTAMSERVRMLGGLFDINSQIGRGTSISMSVPVNKN